MTAFNLVNTLGTDNIGPNSEDLLRYRQKAIALDVAKTARDLRPSERQYLEKTVLMLENACKTVPSRLKTQIYPVLGLLAEVGGMI